MSSTADLCWAGGGCVGERRRQEQEEEVNEMAGDGAAYLNALCISLGRWPAPSPGPGAPLGGERERERRKGVWEWSEWMCVVV